MNSIKLKYLEQISDDFQLLAEIVLRQLSIARQIVDGNHNELMEEMKKNETLIDGLDIKMQEKVINAIFLFNPRAMDLRKIISFHDMTIYLERVGDLILNINNALAKCNFDSEIYTPFKINIDKMLKYVEKMVRNSVYAFSCEDNSMARDTILSDQKVDALYAEINRDIHELFKEKLLSSQDLQNITSINHISYTIERIGDNATNIAEAAIYLIEGKDIRHGNK